MSYSVILLISLLMAGFLSCHNRPSEYPNERTPLERETVQKLGPYVTVEIEPELFLDKPLQFKWRIRNPGIDRILVYTSLLENPNYSQIVVNPETKVIEIQFTREQPIGAMPYDFPATRTIELTRTQDYFGEYSSDVPLRDVVIRSVSGDIKKTPLTTGPWTIRAAIAWKENDELLRATDGQNEEHPINQVVHWQKLAYSADNPVTVRQ